jgi:hypothetical protein
LLKSRFVGGHPGPHTDACFVYDHSIAPGTGLQWKTFPSLPDGRSGGGLCYSKTRNALVYAGGAERPSSTVYIDYPHTWMYLLGNHGTAAAGWKPMKDRPILSNHMSYVAAKDEAGRERLFYLGGQKAENEKTGNVADNYEYNATQNVWTQRRAMPVARGHASSSTRAISCGFLVAGGTTNRGKTKDISYYDIPSDTWTQVGLLPAVVNTPVCDVDFVNGYLYCETGLPLAQYSYRVRIDV